MEKRGYVYFLSNRKRGVIYIGVTSNLVKRTHEHKSDSVAGFTKRYRLKHLVYYEAYDDIGIAIATEKKLKNLSRNKKIEIIERLNPEWKDLYKELVS